MQMNKFSSTATYRKISLVYDQQNILAKLKISIISGNQLSLKLINFNTIGKYTNCSWMLIATYTRLKYILKITDQYFLRMKGYGSKSAFSEKYHSPKAQSCTNLLNLQIEPDSWEEGFIHIWISKPIWWMDYSHTYTLSGIRML